jgi:hypothetical protein
MTMSSSDNRANAPSAVVLVVRGPFRLVQATLGVAGALCVALFVIGDSLPMQIAYGVATALTLGIAYRAGRARVEVSDRGVVVHRVGRALTIDRNEIRDVQPAVSEDRVVALLWAPVIRSLDGDIELASLMGYARRGSTNHRVERQSSEIQQALHSPGCP